MPIVEKKKTKQLYQKTSSVSELNTGYPTEEQVHRLILQKHR